LNRWVEVLQTSALPLGYAAESFGEKNGRHLQPASAPCQAQKKRSMNSGSFVMSMDLQKYPLMSLAWQIFSSRSASMSE
jgi:hypothetical protein